MFDTLEIYEEEIAEKQPNGADLDSVTHGKRPATPEIICKPSVDAHLKLVSSTAEPQYSSDVRRCSHCGGEMTTDRYKRHFLRFQRCYDCKSCANSFKQDTRGFQGFYLGVFALVAGPILVSAASIAPGFGVQWLLLAFPLALASKVVYANIARYLQAPVIWRKRHSFLLPKESGRSLIGRTLAGESRICGFALAASGVLAIYAALVAALVLTNLR